MNPSTGGIPKYKLISEHLIAPLFAIKRMEDIDATTQGQNEKAHRPEVHPNPSFTSRNRPQKPVKERRPNSSKREIILKLSGRRWIPRTCMPQTGGWYSDSAV